MADETQRPVTLPGYAVTDLLAYLDRVDAADDHEARVDVLFEMAGYLRSFMNRHAQGGKS